MEFDWDENKSKSNLKKHQVSFEEAKSLFYDPLTLIAPDPDHSSDENRFIAVGYSSSQRLLIVAHCYIEETEIIRIINARKLTKTERSQYEEGL